MESDNKKKRRVRLYRISKGYGIPFLIVLGILTVVAFILPLRPTRSYSEKRNLQEFPEFSVETLLSGEYFDDITLWFSDTFPGREWWMSASKKISALHGLNDVAVTNNNFHADAIPTVPVKPQESSVTEEVVTAENESSQQDSMPEEAEVMEEGAEVLTEDSSEEETIEASEEKEESSMEIVDAPEGSVEEWGGIDAGEMDNAILGNVIQIGGSAFSYFGFSQYYSDVYVGIVSDLAESLKDKGVRVISAPIPQSIGVMVEPEYQEKLGCSEQGAVLDYMMGSMADSVYGVNMFPKLVSHNNEYLYFRTDHHWTAIGAYYGYQSICETLGMEAAPLESFEPMEMGEFIGTTYGSAPQPYMLELDDVVAYNPPGNVTFQISDDGGYSFYEWPVITDLSYSNEYVKYSSFIAGDHSLSIMTNEDLPDGKTCVVIKDSCGNPIVPFLSQNYYKVYVLDFRAYNRMNVSSFVEEYDVDDVILAHMLGMVQGEGANSIFSWLLR